MSRWIIGRNVPWNATWTSELQYEIRSCRYAGSRKAIWQPHRPGEGEPVFAKPHSVRQRKSIAEMRCTVCGDKTDQPDRWWFRLGRIHDGFFMTTEAPVHRRCADHALKVCPRLRDGGGPVPMPIGYGVFSSIIGGPAVEADFGLCISPHESVLGSLKLVWPLSFVKRNPEMFGVGV